MIKDKLLANLKTALKKIGVEEKEINLEHPANSDFGDFATSIALKLAGRVVKGNFLANIEWIIKNVKNNNFETIAPKEGLPVGILNSEISRVLRTKNALVYLKPRIYGKIMNWWKYRKGHPEVISEIFLLPFIINSPISVYFRKEKQNIYLFTYKISHHGVLVIEVEESKQNNEIITMFFLSEKRLKEYNFVLDNKKSFLGRTRIPSLLALQAKPEGAGARFPSLQESQLFYTKHLKESQVNILTYQERKSPMEWANDTVKNFPKDDLIEKVEVIKPGFINFWISSSYFVSKLKEFAQEKFEYPSFYLGENKKIMIEFAHPNTHKLFHIGHLRNISIGESLVRIFEVVGDKVIRSNYQGDIGLHIAKCLWFIKYKTSKKKLDEVRKKSLHEKIQFLGKVYSKGQIAFDQDEKAKKQIIEINGMIYKNQGDVLKLWKETKKWSFDYFAEIYKRVYSKFDRLYPESEFAQRGIEICKIAEKKGLLKKSEGALVFVGKPYGLDTRVFINSLGYPTYEGKELALAEKEFSEFGQLDKCIHVVTPEQTSFFKVTFKVEELLDEKKFKNKQFHLAYEWVKLKQGKMSSRTGNVVEAEWLIDKAKQKILDKFKCDEKTAEIIAIAAVKYSFLKNNVFSQIVFDFDESISLEGNSGPYLLYTYVRTQSVLKKSDYHLRSTWIQDGKSHFEKEENDLLRIVSNFPEIVYEAAKKLSPNLIANYLYDLAQKYNLFYQKHKILDSEKNTRNFRLLLTKAAGQVIKNGLYLLGIKTVEKM